jgi:hypothetical protein
MLFQVQPDPLNEGVETINARATTIARVFFFLYKLDLFILSELGSRLCIRLSTLSITNLVILEISISHTLLIICGLHIIRG